MTFNDWFSLLFPPAMFIMAAVPSLFIRRSPHPELSEEEQTRKIHRWTLLLWGATAAALVLHLAVYRFIGHEIARDLWVLFFVLWFGIAMPQWRAKNPAAFSSVMNGPQAPQRRGASLRPRQPVVPLIAIAVALSIGLLLALTTAAIAIIRDRHEMPVWWLLLFSLMGILFMSAFGFTARKRYFQPEPMDPDCSPELAQEYASLRRFMGWGFYWLGFSGMLMFALPPLMLAWEPNVFVVPAVMIGAIGGSLVGLAGGVVGTIGGVKRMRINTLLKKLNEQSTVSA